MKDKYLVRDDRCAWRVIDELAFIVTPHDARYHQLNSVGTTIWQLADGAHTVEQVVDALCREFEVAPAQAEADVLEFIDQMTGPEYGLLHLADVPIDREVV